MLTITIEGKMGEGRSILSRLVLEILLERGFEVSLQDSGDYNTDGLKRWRAHETNKAAKIVTRQLPRTDP